MFSDKIEVNQSSIPIFSCVKYLDEYRSLILRAKINGSHTALVTIKKILSESLQKSNFFNSKYDLVIPCPSSPWSRIMGRTDVAFELAQYISDQYKISLKPPPFVSYWNFRKRSFHKHRSLEIQPARNTFFKSKFMLSTVKNQNILLVDDVSTTGWTMLRTSKYFCSSNRFHGIVFSGK